ncbi:MAG: helix-turn-helix transcriptional regulator [Burkholderiales bacterium]|nr:helix-turn-helix transcriptional regulator [Burkholderiales bacterium]
MRNKNNNNESFGAALRALRKTAGKSQETLAWDAGLDRTYISMLELGQRSPTLDTMLALCAALGVSFLELATEIDRRLAAP